MAEQFQNFFVTKLREACDATATTIYVDTVPAITEGTLVLEYANSTKHEIIHFTGVSGYGLTGCTRGLEGTTAQSHSAGTDVRQNLTAGMIDKIINGVITTENIANSAVTTAKINNGAVTADKIDFTTLGIKYDISGNNVSVSNSKTTINSITITESGRYVIFGFGETGHGDNLTLFGLYKGTAELATQRGHGGYLQHASLFAVTDISGEQTVTLTAESNSNTSTKTSHGIIALRIG